VNTLNGAGGNDRVNGGLGSDTLIGGTGQDAFLFTTALDALTNVDTVSDFNVADDVFNLENAVFTALTTTGVLNASLFGLTTTADADDRILYNAVTGDLIYDTNGNTAGGDTIFAKLTTGLALTAADFVVI
jgi:serralysin